MRKTISISIAGQLFHVEEQAYNMLEHYLQSIRSHFASYEDRDEIVSDIETRVAEHFMEKLSKSKTVIAEEDVSDLIAHMGTVKDFEEFEGDHTTHDRADDTATISKRLYRDPTNQMIAGVAAGIANYFGIDPTIVRLMFVASLLFGGAGVVIYIVLWIVLPEARTTSEKVEMHGQALTLKRIEATIRENIPAATQKIQVGTLRRLIQFPFTLIRHVGTAIGRLFAFIGPILVRLIGLCILVVTSVKALLLLVACIMLSINAWEQYMDLPIRQLAGNPVYYTALIGAFLVLLMPLIMFMMLGTSMLLMRTVFRLPIVISMIGVWVAALLVTAVTIASAVPVLKPKVEQYMQQENMETTKQLTLREFESIDVAGGYDVVIRTGTGTAASVTGPASAVESLSVTFEDDVLLIRKAEQMRICIICLGDNHATITMTVADGTLHNVRAYAGAQIDMDGVQITGEEIISSGGTNVTLRNGAITERIVARVRGGGHIDLRPTNSLNDLTLEATGGSSILFDGSAASVVVEGYAGSELGLSGSGSTLTASVAAGSQLNAMDFAVTNAQVEAYAGAEALIQVNNRLTGSAHGGGTILYCGNPQVVDVDSDPSGDVRPWLRP